MKQSRKNAVLDWIEAFLQAAFLVLVINQYLLQAYQIPSGSMIDTLLLGDRIFVNKVVYGPELLPGLGKLPGFKEPDRRSVVIFENPSYIGRGTAFTVLQRVIYMVTLSLVDIDRDEQGRPRAQLLIKRAVGTGGDRFRVRNGDMEVLPAGTAAWITEQDFIESTEGEYSPRRTLVEEDYRVIKAGGRAIAEASVGMPIRPPDRAAIEELRALGFGDPFELDFVREGTVYAARADDVRLRERVQFVRVGWYVPHRRVFPLGDNRDNSRDGRYFGPVPIDDVLGRAMIIYWPIPRAGRIE